MNIDKLKKLSDNVAWLAVADHYEEIGDLKQANLWRDKAYIMDWYLSTFKNIEKGKSFKDYSYHFNSEEDEYIPYKYLKLYIRGKFTKYSGNWAYYSSYKPRKLISIRFIANYTMSYDLVENTFPFKLNTILLEVNTTYKPQKESTHVKRVENIYKRINLILNTPYLIKTCLLNIIMV